MEGKVIGRVTEGRGKGRVMEGSWIGRGEGKGKGHLEKVKVTGDGYWSER